MQHKCLCQSTLKGVLCVSSCASKTGPLVAATIEHSASRSLASSNTKSPSLSWLGAASSSSVCVAALSSLVETRFELCVEPHVVQCFFERRRACFVGTYSTRCSSRLPSSCWKTHSSSVTPSDQSSSSSSPTCVFHCMQQYGHYLLAPCRMFLKRLDLQMTIAWLSFVIASRSNHRRRRHSPGAFLSAHCAAIFVGRSPSFSSLPGCLNNLPRSLSLDP